MGALFSIDDLYQLPGQVDVFEAIAEVEAETARSAAAVLPTDGALFALRATDGPTADGALFGLTV